MSWFQKALNAVKGYAHAGTLFRLIMTDSQTMMNTLDMEMEDTYGEGGAEHSLEHVRQIMEEDGDIENLAFLWQVGPDNEGGYYPVALIIPARLGDTGELQVAHPPRSWVGKFTVTSSQKEQEGCVGFLQNYYRAFVISLDDQVLTNAPVHTIIDALHSSGIIIE